MGTGTNNEALSIGTSQSKQSIMLSTGKLLVVTVLDTVLLTFHPKPMTATAVHAGYCCHHVKRADTCLSVTGHGDNSASACVTVPAVCIGKTMLLLCVVGLHA